MLAKSIKMFLCRKRLLLSGLAASAFLAGFGPIPCARAAAEPESQTGRIEGAVRYVSDSERPWKFSRYYVKDSEKGFLAEAVVALENPGLRSEPPDQKHNATTIDQIDFQFVPETVAIQSGNSVRFTNSDESIHNVMTTDGERPFNVNMPKGGEYVHVFKDARGIAKPVRLGCVYHGGMRGWVFVFDHPWFRVTSRDGQFQWENIPPGTYRLEMIHPAGRLEWRSEIEIKANETIRLEIVVSPDNIRASKR